MAMFTAIIDAAADFRCMPLLPLMPPDTAIDCALRSVEPFAMLFRRRQRYAMMLIRRFCFRHFFHAERHDYATPCGIRRCRR